MKKIILGLALLLVGCQANEQSSTPPNIIYILADDLGYGELGVYGQEKIKTPHIDALAQNGMLFTQHYSGAPVCAPARYMFLTGKHSGHAHIRGNDEWRERGEVWDYIKAFEDPNLEGQRPIPSQTLTLGKQLKKAGYQTAIIGKWGLGAPLTEGVPNRQGFDYFYGYNCQRQAHNLYPGHLWENDTKVLLNNALIAPHVKLDPQADPNDPASYADYTQQDYAPKLMHDKALSFIRTNKDQRFFLYYASPLPHLPLQAPREYVARYQQIFGPETPYTGDKGYFPNQTPRATYAAMISYLDDQVGELVSLLKELDLYDNTLIVFTSDNGPTYTGGVDFDFFNSAGALSNGYGRTKGFVYEGGVRVPFIASWPGKIAPGTVNDHPSTFYDMMPTFSAIAGIDPPADTDGISFKDALFQQPQKKHDFLYWEFPSYTGQQAVRMGPWKGIRKNILKENNLTIELYHLEDDPQETKDVAEKHPEIVAQIQQIMEEQHRPAIIERFKMPALGD
ncbi:MAG: arylsulfatase [Flavobacteriaceae bacterium]|jgi:arylsulfatase A-like enzyme